MSPLTLVALWISEPYYERWRLGMKLWNKARGIVLFDRVLNEEYRDFGAPK